ncbi:hypothetical protein IMCC1989_2127 [gamma proteobacterium IMCC1989]|nr:hypothetical protein IMCC1989_2127 [gamma proteobacterium IMCC1989]
MPKLNEYLGSVISSLTNARVMADLQTVKVAEEYAKHDLLQHFSVPRMRVDDVELTIPIALESTQQKLSTHVDTIDNTEFNKSLYKEVTRGLGLSSLPRAASSEIRSLLAENTHQLEKKVNLEKTTESVNGFSHEITEKILTLNEKYGLADKEITIDKEIFKRNISQLAEKQINTNQSATAIENLQVIAESHLLKEQKPESIIYIKMKISEDGMEWQKMDDDNGKTTQKLLPE